MSSKTYPPAKRIVLAITSASGTIYARALLTELLQLDYEVHVVVSENAFTVMREEMELTFAGDEFNVDTFMGALPTAGRAIVYKDTDIGACIASGSFRTAGMVVCPCSMRTVGLIASGSGGSLICRSADVALKERRPLVLVARETPLSLVHLKNMVAVTEAGAVVMPPMPAFYNQPKTIHQIVRHIVLKILDALGVEHQIGGRWKEGV